MFSISDDDRITGASLSLILEGGLKTIHHYVRFIGEDSELWIFGAGLGEYTLAQQLGDSFLSLVDQGEDPHLGRVMWSLGYNPAALLPYKGDVNILWSYGIMPHELESKLKEFKSVTPDIILSPHKALREKAVELGMESYHMHAGVGRFFHPLGLERTKIGFAGLDSKGRKQRRIVLGPAMDRGELDWRSRHQTDEYMNIDKLNEFYNSLKVTFGMVDESRQNIDYMPSRLFETLATQTPLIIYKLHNFEKNMGFSYPYQTTSYEETKEHMEYILDNHEEVMQQMKGYAKYVKENHSYEEKLRMLFKEMKANR